MYRRYEQSTLGDSRKRISLWYRWAISTKLENYFLSLLDKNFHLYERCWQICQVSVTFVCFYYNNSMKVHIITNFTDAFTSYFDSSIMRIARGKGLFEPIFYNLGDYSLQAQHRVDDKPYGGGAGALIEIEPMYRAVTSIDPENRMKKIYL